MPFLCLFTGELQNMIFLFTMAYTKTEFKQDILVTDIKKG